MSVVVAVLEMLGSMLILVAAICVVDAVIYPYWGWTITYLPRRRSRR